MSDLASLVVRLSAETSQYNASIQKATEQIGSFSDKVGESIRDVAKDLLGLEALKEVFDFSENIVKTLASFEELSHAVGSTTESLSQLSFAGKLEGIENIAVPLEKLAHSVGEASTGNQKLIDTFSALGVSITGAGGKIKSTDQQLLDIADAVSKYNDGLAKTSAVQAIFGRSGAEFIAFLDQGAEKIRAAKQEAIDLGVSVSSPAAQAAKEFEEDMTRIGAAFQGIFFKALEEVLPVFKQITEQIVEFAKNANNTAPIVEQLVAAFKIVGTVLVVVGTAFEVVGKTIGFIAADIVAFIGELADLATAFDLTAESGNNFAKNLKDEVSDAFGFFTHPGDSVKQYAASLDKELENFGDILLHPIESTKAFLKSQRDAVTDSPVGDIFATLKTSASSLSAIWGNLNDDLSEINVTAKKIKPDLVLINDTQSKALQSAIEELAKLDDKLKEQVATYGLSAAAATVYDVTLGHLSASVDELNKAPPKEALHALEQLEKQGKISKVAFDEVVAAIKTGIPAGDALKTSIIGLVTSLDQLHGVDALSKLDSQLLTMTGHLDEASKAAFDLANRPLRITIQTAQDRTTFSGLDDSQKRIAVTEQLNALNAQAITIQDALGKKVAEVAAESLATGGSTLKVAGEEAAARQAAIAQLQELYIKAEALAESTGLPSATKQALALRDAIGSIQFNPKIVEDVGKAIAAQKELNDLLLKQKAVNDTLAEHEANLAKQSAQGALTDIEYMQKQDEARQQAIDQLEVLYQKEKAVSDANPGNAQALDEYKKLGVQITQLQTQMGQLARTVRNDLTDSLSNAFVDFATGSKSAGAALRSFVSDFSRQMLQLASKQLFQKLFETTGIASGIDSLFGGAAKGASGLAGSTAAATTISTAMTTAATAGGASLGTGITTGATAAATELGGGITSAGTAAAAEMGSAISAAGSEAASAMAAAIAGAGATSSAAGAGIGAVIAAAGGGPIPANQTVLVGEKGPELFVSDLGEQTAATATRTGTTIPDDLTHAHVIGAQGPEFIKPTASGFVVPSDVFLKALSDRNALSLQKTPETPASPKPIAPSTDRDGFKPPSQVARHLEQVVDLAPLIAARLPTAPQNPQPPAQVPLAPQTPQAVTNLSLVAASPPPAVITAPPTPAQIDDTATPSDAFLSVGPFTKPIAPVIEDIVRDDPVTQPPSPIQTDAAVVSTNVLQFPTPSLPGKPAAVAPDSVTEPPTQPDRIDHEVAVLAQTPHASQRVDVATSAMIFKFEKIVKHEQSLAPLDAQEYEALLTDRYLQKRQAGGPVSAGKPYLVGEGGPELMVPDSNGTVMNSWDTQNSRAVVNNVTNHFVINTPTGKVDRASQGQIAARTALSVQAASGRNN